MNFVLTLIGLAGAAAFFVVRFAMKKKLSPILLVLAIAIFALSFSFKIIPTGYTGVRVTFGQVSSTPAPNGWNWRIPFIENIELVNNKRQDYTIVGDLYCQSREQNTVIMTNVTVTYSVSAEKSPWLYANVTDTSQLVSYDLISSALKTASKQIPTDDAISRDVVYPVALRELQAAVDQKYGRDTVTIYTLQIGNIDYTAEYQQTIEDRQQAQIQYETSQIQNQTNIERAEAEASVRVIEAEATAEANRLLEESLSEEILTKMWLDRWDGKLPLVSGSGDGGYMIDISGLTKLP